MTDVFNNERVLVSFKTKRRLSLEKQGTNMVANCLLGHNKTSGLEPDVYTIYLTDKTFFAEYSRNSLHGGLPKRLQSWIYLWRISKRLNSELRMARSVYTYSLTGPRNMILKLEMQLQRRLQRK